MSDLQQTLPSDPVALNEFLVRSGLAAPDTPVGWTPLSGGVSSDIWRVDLPDRTVCVKRALPQLKVAAPWYAPVSRNAYEWAWLRFASKHEPGVVPQPLAHDAEAGLFAMAFLDPADHPVWKRQLLDGVVEPAVAITVGAVLARLHAASAHDPDLARTFDTLDNFHALRLEPYLIATARRHPDLAECLHGLAERTSAARIALVHGDVSPKNILIGPQGPVFLDAECAWYGDPAFDAAFCLNHLLLKCLARPKLLHDYLECFSAFLKSYLDGVSWESADDIEIRVASLLPALLLARVDGKSPVEYVTAEQDKALVRAVAQPLIRRPPLRLDELARCWRDALAARSIH